MKLAFCLFKYYPFGGLEQSFLNIAIEAIEQEFVVDVYTMKWEGDIPNGLNVITVKPKGLSNHSRAFNYSRQIKPLLDQGNYDLVVGFKRMPHLIYTITVMFVLLTIWRNAAHPY
jgi:UDP-glucose:(heptosyl)LPS alpha-1,3-glucosyltransferase